MLCVLIRIYHFQDKKENHTKLSLICNFGNFKNKFETAMVNEPSVFEPLKFFYIFQFTLFTSQLPVPDASPMASPSVPGSVVGDRPNQSKRESVEP